MSTKSEFSPIYCQVAVNSPLNQGRLTYRAGDQVDTFQIGDIVSVPLGKRKEKGCIVRFFNELPEPDKKFAIKSVIKIVDEELSLNDTQIQFYEWVAGYYHYPLGQLIFDSLPKALKKPRVLNVLRGKGEALEFELNETQSKILKTIAGQGVERFAQHLIHGVTGSGKSVIYLKLIEEVLALGKSVLFLLPEINLTPQFLSFFESHLSCGIYSYNSSISNSDKYGLWKLAKKSDTPKLIIGVRSSIFLPIENLGMVIVDEEHDNSFKQEDRCPYNARDLAVKKAHLENIPVILGSATPSLESYFRFTGMDTNAKSYHTLVDRAGEGNLPTVELTDCRGTVSYLEDYWPFHIDSIRRIEKALEKNEQVLVFVNKLGFASFMICHSCGHCFDCPNCHTSLRVFKNRRKLSCHICDYEDALPEICPECGNMNLLSKGFGTERLKEVLQRVFPKKVTARFDRDEISNMTKLEERLNEFHRGEVDILVGTQMLSKGHNFKRVNLVLILGVDNQLNYPDYKANERVYQLLTQVSGRSGRFGKESSVVIQTLAPENDVFTHVKQHSFDEFYKEEISVRKVCEVPPFQRVVMIYLTSKFQDKVISESNNLKRVILDLLKECFLGVNVLGPRPAIIEKKVNKFTWSLMLKAEDVNNLHNLINTLEKNFKPHYSVSIKFDVDPYHMH